MRFLFRTKPVIFWSTVLILRVIRGRLIKEEQGVETGLPLTSATASLHPAAGTNAGADVEGPFLLPEGNNGLGWICGTLVSSGFNNNVTYA